MGSVHVGSQKVGEKAKVLGRHFELCSESHSHAPPQLIRRAHRLSLGGKPAAHQLSWGRNSRQPLFGMCAVIPWAGFPEIVWWHRGLVAAGQLAPSEHTLLSGSPGKQAELPPQMALILLLILSLPHQYFHRQLKIPAGSSVDVHSSSLCLEPPSSIFTWL